MLLLLLLLRRGDRDLDSLTNQRNSDHPAKLIVDPAEPLGPALNLALTLPNAPIPPTLVFAAKSNNNECLRMLVLLFTS